MKKFIIASFAALALVSCSSSEATDSAEGTDSTATSENNFKAGEEITEEGAMNATDMLTAMNGKDSMELKLTAKVNAVCQVKGCWMMVDMGSGKEMRVKFKDYAFFVPKDATGKTAVMDGWAKVDTISVAQQKHLAEDAGLSQGEIDAITEPKAEMTFEAKGVILK